MTGSPFSHYPATPASVDAVGETLLTNATTVRTVADQAVDRQLAAAQETDGFLVAMFDPGVSQTRSRGDDLVGAAIVASGAMRVWSLAIGDHDRGIDTLNAEYRAAAASHFGVSTWPLTNPTAGQDPEGPQADFDADVLVAKGALLADLSRREAKLVETLDGTAEEVVGTLAKGPTEESLRTLMEAGALPMTVPALLPRADFGDVDIRKVLEGMERRGELPPGVDIDHVTEALGGIDGLLGKDDFGVNGNADDLRQMMDSLKNLDDNEIDFVLLGLSDEELERLDELAAGTDDSGTNPFDHNGLDHWDLLDFHALMLSNASRDNLARIQDAWRSIDPAATGNEDSYGIPDRTDLWDEDEYGNSLASYEDVEQGSLGDCWVIAKIAALQHDTAADGAITFAEQNIRRNDNGTVSVTMYDDDGNGHTVTVTEDLPLDADGNPVYAHGADGQTWPAYYEKAFALASDHHHDGQDGYAGIESGSVTDDVQLMTGQDGDDIDDDYDSVREKFDDGHAVVMSSNGNDDDIPDDQAGNYVTNHQFYVLEMTDDQVVLGNPHGTDTTPLTLSRDEFDENFDGAGTIR